MYLSGNWEKIIKKKKEEINVFSKKLKFNLERQKKVIQNNTAHPQRQSQWSLGRTPYLD